MSFLRRNLHVPRLWTAFSCSPRRSHVADVAGEQVTEAALTAQPAPASSQVGRGRTQRGCTDSQVV